MSRQTTVVICFAVILGAFVSLWFTFRTPTLQVPKEEIVGFNTGLGQVLGEETAKVVTDHGHIVVVAWDSLEQLKQQRPNYMWIAFESELQKHSINITAVENARNAWNGYSATDDRAAFKALLDRYTNADAVVFLIDLPNWDTVAELFSTPSGPKIIALNNLRQQPKSRYGGYFANGMLVALISAPNKLVPASQAKTPREWFDRNYQVYTPQNYESLP